VRQQAIIDRLGWHRNNDEAMVSYAMVSYANNIQNESRQRKSDATNWLRREQTNE